MKIIFSFIIGFMIVATTSAADRPACGLQGTVPERIAACAHTDNGKPSWILVARAMDGSEIWLDGTTNIFWSQVLKRPRYGSALKISFSKATEFCAEQANAVELAGLIEEWRLPAITEYETAIKANPSVIKDRVGYEFWSDTSIDNDYAWAYLDTALKKQFKLNSRAIRCVANYNPNQDENLPTPSPGAPPPIPIKEVLRVMTKLDWGNSSSHWSSYLEVDHCEGSRCFIREMLSSEQVCDTNEPDGKWCEVVSKTGDIKLEPGGFFFTEYGSTKSTRCDLSFESASKTWWLNGKDCDFLGLSAHEL